MSKKALFEPDYRRRGWREVKEESRAVFGCASLLALGVGWLLLSNMGKYPDLVVPAWVLFFVCLLIFPLGARLIMQRKVVRHLNASAFHVVNDDSQTRYMAPFATKPAYDLTPSDFECEIAHVFEQLCAVNGQPIKAQVVGGVGDGGIDIKLWDRQGMLVGIVQAKRYQPGSVVPPTHIRDLDSVRRRYGVRAAYLVTTATFSSATYDLAKECNIKLIDGAAFERQRQKLYQSASSTPQYSAEFGETTSYASNGSAVSGSSARRLLGLGCAGTFMVGLCALVCLSSVHVSSEPSSSTPTIARQYGLNAAMSSSTLPPTAIPQATATQNVQPTANPTDTPAVVVNSLLDDPNGCPQTCTLRSAINTAAPGSTVGFDPALQGVIQLVDVIAVSKDVAIAASGFRISIDGRKQNQLFSVDKGTLKLYGLKLQNAKTSKQGGAIDVGSGAVEVYDSIFENNTSSAGGAISIHGFASLKAVNTTFTGNNAGEAGALELNPGSKAELMTTTFNQNVSIGGTGGAIYNAGNLVISQSTFSENKARKPGAPPNASGQGGGAIFNILGGKLQITSSTFIKNTSDSDGGALVSQVPSMSSEPMVTLESSSFIANIAENDGGAVVNSQMSALSVNNCTFSGNLAKRNGGAVWNNGSITIQFSTMFENGAKGVAGGIYLQGGTLTLSSSIVARNVGGTTPDISSKVKSGGNNLIGNPAGTSNWFASDLQKVDPLLQPLALNVPGQTQTMALKDGSPAIGKGGTACPPTDQRGVPRKNPCDIGAYESNS